MRASREVSCRTAIVRPGLAVTINTNARDHEWFPSAFRDSLKKTVNPPVTVPVCEKKAELVRAYTFAVSDHDRAYRVLKEHVGTLTKSQYERLKRYAEKSAVKVEETKAALDHHTVEHGC